MEGDHLLDDRLLDVLFRAEELLLCHTDDSGDVSGDYEGAVRCHPIGRRHHLRYLQVNQRRDRGPHQRPLAPGAGTGRVRGGELPLRLHRQTDHVDDRHIVRPRFRRRLYDDYGGALHRQPDFPGLRFRSLQSLDGQLGPSARTGHQDEYLEHLPQRRGFRGRHHLRLSDQLATLFLGAGLYRARRYFLHHRDAARHAFLRRTARTSEGGRGVGRAAGERFQGLAEISAAQGVS